MKVGRYELSKLIGSGGMGSVHLGRQSGSVGFSRPVAIKRLHRHIAQNPDIAALFLDEARLASRVRHVNVAEIVDVVRDGQELLIVMGLVEGVTLSTLLREGGAITVDVASAIIAGALRGLHAAHVAVDRDGTPLEIVHRDVSPHNVMVGADGSVRVLDFGVAKAKGQFHATRPGDVRGKLAYMAPEQLRGGAIPASDVFAVGLVFWEMLAGHKLRDGDAAGLLGQVLSGEVPPLPPGTPHAVERLIRSALSTEPNDRPASALEMATELDRLGASASPTVVGAYVERTCPKQLRELREAVAEAERNAPHTAGPEDGSHAPTEPRPLTLEAAETAPAPLTWAATPTPAPAPGPNAGRAPLPTMVSRGTPAPVLASTHVSAGAAVAALPRAGSAPPKPAPGDTTVRMPPSPSTAPVPPGERTVSMTPRTVREVDARAHRMLVAAPARKQLSTLAIVGLVCAGLVIVATALVLVFNATSATKPKRTSVEADEESPTKDKDEPSSGEASGEASREATKTRLTGSGASGASASLPAPIPPPATVRPKSPSSTWGTWD